MRKLVVMVLALSFVLTGCNTIAGFVNGMGKDTEKAGVWVQDKVPVNSTPGQYQ